MGPEDRAGTHAATRAILITGANRGIGLSIASVYARRFPLHTIILTSRSKAAAEAAIDTLVSSGVTASLHAIELDVTDDESITAAVESVRALHGGLDILINNAGMASVPGAQCPPLEHRSIFSSTFNVNVASVYNLSLAFAPLLSQSEAGAIVNVSSGRASLSRSADAMLPPTASVSYSVSKAALNSLSIELGKLFSKMGVGVVVANPGHCKTAFNGFRGKRDPEEGARVIVEVIQERLREGFWEIVEDGGILTRAPW